MALTQRIRKINPAKIDAYSQLVNPIVAANFDERTYRKAVANFIFHEKPNDFEEKFVRLYSKERFRLSFNASVHKIEDLLGTPIYNTTAPSPNTEIIYKLLIELNSKKVKKFLELRHFFEASFLRGDNSKAQHILGEVERELGESIWTIRSRMLLLNQQGRLDELETFVGNCKSSATHAFVKSIINWLWLVASDPLLHSKKTVAVTVKELEKGGEEDWARLIELIFIPRSINNRTPNEDCFYLIQAFPMVDQVWMMELLAGDLLIAGDPPQKSKAAPIAEQIERLRQEILLQSGTHEAAIKSIIHEFIELYETDDLRNVATKFQNSIQSAELDFSLLNILAKSAARDRSVLHEERSPTSRLITTLASIYSLEKSPKQLQDDYLNQTTNLNYFSCAEILELAIFKAMPYSWEKERLKNLAKVIATTNASTPMTLRMALTDDYLLDFEYETDKNSLPQYRKARLKIHSALKSAQINDSSLNDLILDYRELCPLKRDHIELAAAIYLKESKFDELIEFSAHELAKNSNAYSAIPMRAILEVIEREAFHSLEAVTIAYIYATHIDRKKEYVLNEAYEQFIESHGVDRPSALLEVLDFSNPLALIFFRDISTLDNMDYLGSYESSTELRAERINIIDALLDKGFIDEESHDTEVDDILGKIVIDAGAAQFNESKININIAELKRIVLSDFRPIVTLYKSLDEMDTGRFIRLEADEGNDSIPQAIAVGDRKTTLLRALNIVINAFLFDEKYGLDKNLSTEIRHGFFSNLMRSRLEEKKLLTEADASGQYIKNHYWENRNHLLNPEILNDVESHLSYFSKRFNELIRDAEEWMKVSVEGIDASKRVFTYSVDLNSFEEIEVYAYTVDAENLLDYLFARLVFTTQNFLSKVRSRLDTEFRTEVSALFDNLTNNVTESKRGAAMLELMSAIAQTRHEIQEDITVAAEWFKTSDTGISSDRSIDEIIEISIECLRRIKGAAFMPETDFSEGASSVRIAGPNVKTFILVLVTLFENCFRRSGLGLSTNVRVISRRTQTGFTTSISNSLSEERRHAYDAHFLASLDERMRSPKSKHLMRKEGGTGLSKAFNQLRQINPYFDMSVSVNDFGFFVEISYDHSSASH